MANNLVKITTTCDVAKSINEEERLFTAVVLRPDVVDAHGDIYSKDVVKKACHDYVTYCMNQNVQHQVDVEKSDVAVVESWIAPADFTLGSGEVKAGDWVMTVRVDNEDIWKACKKGTFTGFSVGCASMMEILDES